MTTGVLSRAAPAEGVARAVPRTLQRACACGGAARPAGKCTGCEAQERLGRSPLQAKLTVSSPNDPYEHEADRVADQVMRSAAGPPRISPLVQREASDPDDEELQTKAEASTAFAPGPGFAARLSAASAGGAPLPGKARGFFEAGFGRDLGHVRVHDGAPAAGLARDIAARAFTHGAHIYFAPGQYDPASTEGRHLLAHELTHTVQQDPEAASTLRRAVVQVGGQTVTVDYDRIIYVVPADYATWIIAAVADWTGAPPTSTDEATIRALSDAARQWLLFGLELLSENNATAGTLDRPAAVQRLLGHAASAQQTPLPDAADLFVHEILEVSGWLEAALGGRLTTPGAPERAAINLIVNPPESASAPLDTAELRRRLPPAIRSLLTALDPANWTSVGTRSLSAFQVIGDIIQTEARSFFAPYADAAMGNIFSLQPAWHASANIFDTGSRSPTHGDRLGYLANRAEIIGRSTTAIPGVTDLNMFADVHFNLKRPADRAELESINTKLLASRAVAAQVDRLIQHTGQQTGSGPSTSIGVKTEFDAGEATACEDHWRGINTVCHEVLHALVHPAFQASSSRYSYPQVIREGFTEVLGDQLFNVGIIPRASSDASFKTALEAGVSGAPCPAPSAGTIGYGAAGPGAEKIRASVGDDNFRAAYFLGRTDLAGLP